MTKCQAIGAGKNYSIEYLEFPSFVELFIQWIFK